MQKLYLILVISVAAFFTESAIKPASAAPIDNLQPGFWHEVLSSRLDTVDPCPGGGCSYSGNLGVAGVMDAWNGGAFDSARNRLIVWGGGHLGYAGNELYAFDILSETWSRLTEPSTSIQMAVSHYSDGKPTSRHTYNDLQYDSQRDRFVSLNASASYSLNGASFSTVDMFDFGTNSWIAGTDRIDGGGTDLGAFSAYDPASGLHYIHHTNGGRLQMYDPGTGQWSNHVVTGSVPIYMTADIDPIRRNLVAVGAGRIFVYDLDNLNAQPLKAVASGNMAAQNADQIGFQYDAASDQFVAWIGGTSVYVLDPVTWVWTQLAPAAGNTVSPGSPNMNGTYGRFRYVPSKNAFIVVNNVDQNVYYYKLSAGGGGPAAPTVSILASPAQVSSGEFSTLGWSTTGADSCTTSGGWSGSVGLSGTSLVGPITVPVTYTLTCTGAGGTVIQSVTVTVAAGGGGGQTGDWGDRSSAAGVVMATRFDTQADVTNWLAGSNADHVSWDQNLKASGNGSLRFDILRTDGAAGGNWARWLADDQREFAPGDEFYVQYRQFIPAYLATHPFLSGGGWKQSIISRHAASMNGANQVQPYGSNQLNEIVLQNTNHRGLVQGYNRNTDGQYPPWEISAVTACSGTDFIYQNAIDWGPQNAGSACENDRARYGGLYSYYQQQPAGYVQGSPDPVSGGFRYYPDEWLTFLIHVRLGQYGGYSNDTQVKVYAARDGAAYQLILDRNDLDLGNGPNHNTLWLLPYNTGRVADMSRQDTFTNYDEVIVSTSFISAPGTAVGQQKSMPPTGLVAE